MSEVRRYYIRMLHDDRIISLLTAPDEPQFEGPLFRIGGEPFELSKIKAHGFNRREVERGD